MSAGPVIAVLGLVLGLAVALADVIGMGSPGFGRNQVMGTVAGAIIVIVGVVLSRRSAGGERAGEEGEGHT